jgi:hypothetical protein
MVSQTSLIDSQPSFLNGGVEMEMVDDLQRKNHADPWLNMHIKKAE